MSYKIEELTEKTKLDTGSIPAIERLSKLSNKQIKTLQKTYLDKEFSKKLIDRKRAIEERRKLITNLNPGVDISHISDMDILRHPGMVQQNAAKKCLHAFRRMAEKKRKSIGIWPNCVIGKRYRLWFHTSLGAGFNVPAVLYPGIVRAYNPQGNMQPFYKDIASFIFWTDEKSKVLTFGSRLKEITYGVLRFCRGINRNVLIVESDEDARFGDVSGAPKEVLDNIRLLRQTGGVRGIKHAKEEVVLPHISGTVDNTLVGKNMSGLVCKEIRLPDRPITYSFLDKGIKTYLVEDGIAGSVPIPICYVMSDRLFLYIRPNIPQLSMLVGILFLKSGALSYRSGWFRITKALGRKLLPGILRALKDLYYNIRPDKEDMECIRIFREYYSFHEFDRGLAEYLEMVYGLFQTSAREGHSFGAILYFEEDGTILSDYSFIDNAALDKKLWPLLVF